jgi:serralysin
MCKICSSLHPKDPEADRDSHISDQDAGAVTSIRASYAQLAALMPADISAMQSLYGTDADIRSGNTTYGNNANITGDMGRLMDQVFGTGADARIIQIDNPAVLTIHDRGGYDTLDFSNTAADQRITLNALGMSNVYGLTENLQIARGVVIEAAIGGRGNDRLTGNNVANSLIGNAGNDTLAGGLGDDTLDGGANNDDYTSGTGADSLIFAAGADRIRDFVNNVDTIVLDRDLWGGGNRSAASVLGSFGEDIGSSVLLHFSGGNTLRVDGASSVNALLDDISFV